MSDNWLYIYKPFHFSHTQFKLLIEEDLENNGVEVNIRTAELSKNNWPCFLLLFKNQEDFNSYRLFGKIKLMSRADALVESTLCGKIYELLH